MSKRWSKVGKQNTAAMHTFDLWRKKPLKYILLQFCFRTQNAFKGDMRYFTHEVLRWESTAVVRIKLANLDISLMGGTFSYSFTPFIKIFPQYTSFPSIRLWVFSVAKRYLRFSAIPIFHCRFDIYCPRGSIAASLFCRTDKNMFFRFKDSLRWIEYKCVKVRFIKKYSLSPLTIGLY